MTVSLAEIQDARTILKAVPTHQRMFFMRYSPTGTIADSFVGSFINGREAGGSDILLQPDGRLLIGGFTQSPSDNNLILTAARFNQ